MSTEENITSRQQLLGRVVELSNQYEEAVLRLRREIHVDPELSFQEHRTAVRVEQALREIGLSPKCGIAGTGIIADLQSRSGKDPAAPGRHGCPSPN